MTFNELRHEIFEKAKEQLTLANNLKSSGYTYIAGLREKIADILIDMTEKFDDIGGLLNQIKRKTTMIKLTCKTEKGIFDKTFDTPKKARSFYLRCKHSNKIKVIGIFAYDYSLVEFVKRGY